MPRREPSRMHLANSTFCDRDVEIFPTGNVPRFVMCSRGSHRPLQAAVPRVTFPGSGNVFGALFQASSSSRQMLQKLAMSASPRSIACRSLSARTQTWVSPGLPGTMCRSITLSRLTNTTEPSFDTSPCRLHLTTSLHFVTPVRPETISSVSTKAPPASLQPHGDVLLVRLQSDS